MPAMATALADGGAAGEQGHGLGRPAVVAQRGERGSIGLAAVPTWSPAAVKPPAPRRRRSGCNPGPSVDRPGDVGAGAGGIARDDRVDDRRPGVRAAQDDRRRRRLSAELPLIVQAVSVGRAVSSTRRRRSSAELPLIVQSVSVAVP